VPTFILGVVLGYLTTRCGSILPSMLFHVLHKTTLMASTLFWPGQEERFRLLGMEDWQRTVLVCVCTPLAIALLWWLTRHPPHPAYVAFLESDPGMERLPSSPEIALAP